MNRILLLERDYQLTRTLLRDAGILVDTATSTETASELITSHDYHTLILDPENQNGQVPNLLERASAKGLTTIIISSIPKEQLPTQGIYYFRKPLNTKPDFFKLLKQG
jgi:DNA-binding NtrC family response regulator